MNTCQYITGLNSPSDFEGDQISKGVEGIGGSGGGGFLGKLI